MTRIFTPPDIDFNRTIDKVFVRNCTWTLEQIQEVAEHLGEKDYDIYIYHNEMNDVQWAEGIRTHSKKVYDWKHYSTMQPEEFLRIIDDEF